MAKHGNKETLMITLYPDVKKMVEEQARALNMSISSYIERLIFEKNCINNIKVEDNQK